MEGEDVLLDVARSLEAWGWQRGWVGPDPYDALNGKLLGVPRSRLGRRAVIQAVKRSPVDLRGVLRIAPRRDSAAIAHVLSAYVRADVVDGAARESRIDWCVEQLADLRTGFSSESSWGYHFDVETRFFFYPETTPNTIATAFAGLSLLDAYEATGDDRTLGLAASAGRFLLESVERTVGRGGAYFGYFPGDRSPIHNASLLACCLLARLVPFGGDDTDRLAEAVQRGVGFALAHQRPDGSWPYAETPAGQWVDGLHTGYVLDALLDCSAAAALSPEMRQEVLAAWARGLDFYSECLFDRGEIPRFTSANTYPIDGQYVAQAIETFSRAAAVEPARLADALRVFDFALRRMRRSDGSFAFQRHRFWVNSVPHVRWVQAPMLAAFGALISAGAGRQRVN